MTADTMGDLRSPAVETEKRNVDRFYDRLRGRIHRYAEGSRAVERVVDLLLLVPDVFMLLWRLMNDSRVSGKDKVLLGRGVAYFMFPLDVVPEALLGPIGYLDDLIFGVYILNKLIVDTDVEVLREHWSGHEDVLDMIRRVLDAADKLLADDIVAKLKNMTR